MGYAFMSFRLRLKKEKSSKLLHTKFPARNDKLVFCLQKTSQLCLRLKPTIFFSGAYQLSSQNPQSILHFWKMLKALCKSVTWKPHLFLSVQCSCSQWGKDDFPNNQYPRILLVGWFFSQQKSTFYLQKTSSPAGSVANLVELSGHNPLIFHVVFVVRNYIGPLPNDEVTTT